MNGPDAASAQNARLIVLSKLFGKTGDGRNKVHAQTAYRTAGDAARDRHDWIEAATAYARHVERVPGDTAIWIQLGHARKEGGDLAGADAAYATAVTLDGDDSDLLLIYGRLKRMRGEVLEAARLVRASFEVDLNQLAGRELEDPYYRGVLAEIERGVPPRSHALVTPVDLRALPVGAVDTMEGWVISGWAADAGAPDASAEVAFFVDGKHVGTVTPGPVPVRDQAARHRLAAGGVQGTDRSGFQPQRHSGSVRAAVPHRTGTRQFADRGTGAPSRIVCGCSARRGQPATCWRSFAVI